MKVCYHNLPFFIVFWIVFCCCCSFCDYFFLCSLLSFNLWVSIRFIFINDCLKSVIDVLGFEKKNVTNILLIVVFLSVIALRVSCINHICYDVLEGNNNPKAIRLFGLYSKCYVAGNVQYYTAFALDNVTDEWATVEWMHTRGKDLASPSQWYPTARWYEGLWCWHGRSVDGQRACGPEEFLEELVWNVHLKWKG